MSTAENKAVFLSYASQDAEAARKICETLRASGVEVWFDAEGGLEHGDEWDAKIRRQIKECVLFIPVISANTQAREEGYFRIEWELAAQRALGIASGVAFILPVVIDDTREPDALVPDRFRMVQWTRLRGGEISPDVKQRFLKLWSHRAGVLKYEAASASAEKSFSAAPTAREVVGKSSAKTYALLAAGVTLVVAAAGWWMLHRATSLSKPAATLVAPKGKDEPGRVPNVSAAREHIARARALSLNKYDSTADDFAAAEALVKSALELDQNDAEIWAFSSQLNYAFLSRGFDHAPSRAAAARSQAERALSLDPDSLEALVALSRWQRDNEDSAIAQATLQKILAREPNHVWALGALAWIYERDDRLTEAIALYERALDLPGAQPALTRYLEFLAYFHRAHFEDAERCIRQSVELQPSANSQAGLALLLLTWKGDADGAARVLASGPTALRSEPRTIWTTALAQLCQRQPEAVLKTLGRYSNDYIQDNWFAGPPAFFAGEAHAMAGRMAAARIAWESGLAVVEARLKSAAENRDLRAMRGLLLARLGRNDEALAEARTLKELSQYHDDYEVARIYAVLGRADDALPTLERHIAKFRAHENVGWPLTPALLRIDPSWDKLRSDPRFQALCVDAKETSALPAANEKSVAVLAFDNRSDDPAAEYFSDGISEELINALGRVPGLAVKGSTSAFFFKGKNASAPEIGARLGVAYLVRGSVRKAGGKVRITAQLCRAATDEVVWSSEPLERDLKDVFAVQDEIVALVAKNLSVKLGTPRPAHVVNPAAYELVLRGRAIFTRGIPAEHEKAIQFYKEAVALDADYAVGWAALAIGYSAASAQGAMHTETGFALSREAANRAIALDADLAEAHYALGFVRFLADWDWAGADAELRRALVLAPNDVTVLSGAATVAQTLGQADRALALSRKAVELDPLAFLPSYTLCKSFLQTRRYAEMEKLAEQMIGANPGSRYGYFFLTLAHLLQQHGEAAAKAWAPVKLDLFQQLCVALVQYEQGRKAESDAAIDTMIAKFSAGGCYQIAEAYAYRHEADRAFEWLEKGVRVHDAGTTWTPYDPLLASLHDDPRWLPFLQRLQLPNPAKK